MNSVESFNIKQHTFDKKHKNNYSALLHCMLLIIMVRPLIDLFGTNTNGINNLGGIAGFLIFVLASFVLLFRTIQTKKISVYSLLFLLIVLGYFIAFLSSGITNDSIVSLVRYLSGFSFIIVLFLYKKLKSEIVINYAKFFIVLIFVPIFIAWLQYFNLYPIYYYDVLSTGYFGRPSGGYLQPNSLTRILIFGIIYVYLIDKIKKINIYVKYFLVLTYLITIFITGHRTSLLIALLIILILDVLFKFKRTIIFSPLIIGVGILLTIIFLNFFNDKLVEYKDIYINIFSDSISSNGFELRGRNEIWSFVFSEISNRYGFSQWLFGLGRPFFESHNDFIRIFMVNGIYGLFTYILLFIVILKDTFIMTKKSGRTFIFVLYIYLILYGITLQPTEYPHFMQLFFFTILLIKSNFEE